MPCFRSFMDMTGTVILIYALLSENVYLIKASVGKAKVPMQNNAIPKEQSSNQISVKEEEKVKLEEQLYYLPLQTVFGETNTLVGAGSVSTTSPPHISIEPAPIQTKYQQSTNVLYEDVLVKEYHNTASQCVSETPVIELESRFLFPSKYAVKESVIMSGHLEIASKTSSVEEMSEVNNVVSKPSVAVQGTEFHSHTIADL